MPSSRDRGVAWSLVAGQFALIIAIVVLPEGAAWTVPPAAGRVLDVVALVGIGIMVVGALGLGRGLTASPLPNDQAQLRTGGPYRWVRHPIYTGLLLFALARTLTSASVWTVLACLALIVLLNVKAGWEESQLERRFPGYAEYRSRTPRFVPRPGGHS